MSLLVLLLKSLGYLFLFILIFLGLLVLSPIGLKASAHQNVYRFKGSYLFGMIRFSFDKGHFDVRIFGFKIKSKSAQKKKDEAQEKDTDAEILNDKSKKADKKKRKWQIPNREVVFYTLKALKKILHIIKPKTFEGTIRFGLLDPYDTGMVALLINTLPLNIRIVPNYETVDLEVSGQIEIRFSIGQILGVFILWVLKKPVRKYVFSKA